ncbi:MAG: trigger factor [Bacteroides sp.]|nr:trigger factor [Bacillota bacterium]MCM1393457.1 trigger factor [[Eubacterium] siraeum]MCM1455043.1 trigger factor [Bacteroides sp.]
MYAGSRYAYGFGGYMNYTVEKLEKSQVKFNYTATAEEYNKAVDTVYSKTKQKYNVPGFRKGHAPKKVIENLYGPGVFLSDAINQLIDDSVMELEKSKEYELVAFESAEDIDIKDDGSVVYSLIMVVKPEVKLGEYKNLDVKKASAAVTDEQVAEYIKGEQAKQARIIDAEADKVAEKGNIVLIDYSGSVDGEKFDGGAGEDYELELGSNTFIPGFEDQLVGTRAGEQKDVKVTFPEKYHAENLAGKEAVFACTVKAVRVKELPALDDDFAKEVSEFDTFAEYEADVKSNLLDKEVKKVEHDYEDALIEKIVEGSSVEIPEAMIKQETDEMIRDMEYRLMYQGMRMDDYLKYLGMTREQLADEYKPQAEKTVKARLVMEEIIKAENITIKDGDVESRLEKMAEESSQTVEEVRKSMRQDDVNYLINSIISEKLLNTLKAYNGDKEAKKADKADKKADKKAVKAEKKAEKKSAKAEEAVGTEETKPADVE